MITNKHLNLIIQDIRHRWVDVVHYRCISDEIIAMDGSTSSYLVFENTYKWCVSVTSTATIDLIRATKHDSRK